MMSNIILKEVTAFGDDITAINRRIRSLCNFNWTIGSFSSFCSKETTHFPMLKSPSFLAGEDVGKKSEWVVLVWGIDSCLSINLQLLPNSKLNQTHLTTGLQCKFTTSLGSSTDRFDKANTTEHIFQRDCDRWGYIRFADISDLYKYQDILLEDNALRICVQLEIDVDLVDTHLDLLVDVDHVGVKEQKNLQKLAHDFERLFQSSSYREFADINLICGGKVFQCHKNVLAARSSVFCAILQSGMMIMDSLKNCEIIIDDLQPTALSALLKYIYTGKVAELPLTPLSAWTDLIHGADKYDLVDLKNLCFEELSQVICEENVGTLLVAARVYRAVESVTKTMDKFCLENIKTIIHDPNFKELISQYPDAFFTTSFSIN